MKTWRFGLALLVLPLLVAALTTLACLLLIPPAYTSRIAIRLQVPQSELPLYGALLQSNRLADQVIDHFSLQAMWDEPTRHETRERLRDVVRVGGRKGGLLLLEVDAPLPWLAADMASFHVHALQALTDTLRAEAAAERRQRLSASLAAIEAAAARGRTALASSGIDEAVLRGDAALVRSQWSRLSDSLRDAEIQLAMAAQRAMPGSAAYETAAARVEALRDQLARVQSPLATAPSPAPYLAIWREQQHLERLLVRLRLQDQQFALEANRSDKALLLVDRAQLPERAGRPWAIVFIAAAWALSLAGLIAWRRHQKL